MFLDSVCRRSYCHLIITQVLLLTDDLYSNVWYAESDENTQNLKI